MGEALVDLEQVLMSKKKQLTPEEENVLPSCKYKAVRDLTAGALAGGTATWAATWKLSKPFRINLSAGIGACCGLWIFSRSLYSSADQILTMNGSILQRELVNIIVTKYKNDPSLMQLVSKHFYSERIFDDSTSNNPKFGFRYRNFSSEIPVHGHEGHDDESYDKSEDHSHYNSNVKSQGRSESVAYSKRTNFETKRTFINAASSGDATLEVDPLDCLFGYGNSVEETDHSNSPNKPSTIHNRARRYHRRRRVRNREELSNIEPAHANILTLTSSETDLCHTPPLRDFHRPCYLIRMATKRSVGTLKEADLKGKRVFVRVDLNVPLDDNFNITDDTRIRAAVPTIKYLTGYGAKVILSSHLGRPKGVTPKYSLKPLVPRLSQLLGIEVTMANDCIGEEVEKLVAQLPEGGVLLLENVRFYKEEEKNDPEFAKKLASLADLYVNDAFGTAHRAHASTEGVAKYLKPSVAGFLMQKELDYLVGAVANPKKPFAAIVGGSKVSTKIGVIESLLEKVNILLLGGGMVFTFYKAQGYSVGSSLVEEDRLDLAKSLLEKAKAKGVSLLLPTDVVIADKFAADANSKTVPASGIPDGWMGLDIGPDSINTFNESLDTTQTIIWNGPMGVFEFEKFATGTEAIAKKLAELSGKGVTTIIGGGDSVAAVEKAGLADKMSHISTGGGASLELLEGKQLPGVLALNDA
ncbi:hypothetical protein VNO78_13231 [Psophocarpus tetragonolobus]|uniref:Phosphoglycerate kinase n=1 Tax=Psophocarpus tetragonolobus TaxID=3891 RepID=A0AAN9SP00_PSOTE